MSINTRKIQKSEQGFGLIEVLLAAALMSVVAAGLTTIVHSSFASQANLKFRMQADAFNEEVRSLLSSQNACAQSFQGVPLTSSTDENIDVLRDRNGAVRYTKSTPYGDHSFQIQSMRLRQYVDVTGAGGRAELQLTMRKIGATGGGPTEIQRTVQIKTEKSGTSALVDCVAQAKMADGIWTRVSSNMNNIFFFPATDGFVGIGNNNPRSSLEVAGGIRARKGVPNTSLNDSNNLGYTFDGDGDTGLFTENGTSTTGSDVVIANDGNVRMRVTNSGNVGIGTLTSPNAKLDVKNGYIHGQLNCRMVTGPRVSIASVASCAADEWVISGGGACEGPSNGGTEDGFLHESKPLADLSGWQADCFDKSWTIDGAWAEAYAICCKR